MELLIALACGAAGIALLGACLIVPLRLRAKSTLRALSDEALATRVFRFETSYFDYIDMGRADDAVIEFRALVQARDVRGIAHRWRSLYRSFTRLERKVGYRGRPLLLDYYFWYELDYRELIRRMRHRGHAAAT
jgi:hypothetical protein